MFDLILTTPLDFNAEFDHTLSLPDNVTKDFDNLFFHLFLMAYREEV